MKRNSLALFPRTALVGEPFLRNLDQFFGNDLFRPLASVRREELKSTGWIPAVDIRETDDAFEFTAELPGLSKDAVHITIEDNVLTLAGERSWNEDETKDGYRRVERAYGTFSRSFNLPSEVSSDEVTAKFENGLLSVSVPKAEEVKPRQIKIN